MQRVLTYTQQQQHQNTKATTFTETHMRIYLNRKPQFYIIAEGHSAIFIRLTAQRYGGTAYLCYVSQIERKQDMNPTSMG